MAIESLSTGEVATTSGGDRLPGLEVRAVGLAFLAWVAADIGFVGSLSLPVLISSMILVPFGLIRRSFTILAFCVFGLLSYLGASADRAYQPLVAQDLDDVVTIVGDPKPMGAGWRVEVRLGEGARVDASGYGPIGWHLSSVSVGESYRIIGRVRPAGTSGWHRARHIAGQVAVERMELIDGQDFRWAVPEYARSLVVAGASTMSERQRALYLGLVIGDDRLQPLGQRLNFRLAGLTHLLAVSGQNVAFVLAVARGPLQLLGRRSRLVGTIVVLVVFAVMTRMEPSVMRATAAAAIAVWASATGRERSGLIVLSAAVVCVLCADPFLVDSVGFQLSVSASAGILLLGPIIERRLPGPTWLTGPLATTLSAQVGVAPLLTHYFGPVSVASVPANLLAGFAAAAVMTLGLTAGVVAGFLPDQLATIIQWPTTLLLEWLEVVARLGARARVPRFGALKLAALSVAVLFVGRSSVPPSVTESVQRRSLHLRAIAIVVIVLLFSGGWPAAPDAPLTCGSGLLWFPGGEHGSSVLVVGNDAYGSSVEQCLDNGVRSAEVLVAERGGSRAAELVTAIQEVMDVEEVLAPPQHRIVGARRLLEQRVISTAAYELVISSTKPEALAVSVERSEPPADG